MESEVQAWLAMRAEAQEATKSTQWLLNEELLAGLAPSDRH